MTLNSGHMCRVHSTTRINHHQGETGISAFPHCLRLLLVSLSLAEQQYISDILGLINHGDPQIRGATAILCGAILQAALTKTRYSIQPWLANVQCATGLSVAGERCSCMLASF